MCYKTKQSDAACVAIYVMKRAFAGSKAPDKIKITIEEA